MSEKDLINRLLKGEEKALRVFYNKYSVRLKNFIMQRVSDPQDAEEILQDVLLDGLEALRDFTGNSTLLTYLCAIAKYKTIDHYRKKKLRKIVFSKMPAVEKLFTLATTPEDKLDEKITQEKVQEILTQLRPKYRKVLQLKYFGGFSVKQIAAKMGISFKSAESILFRARKDFALAYDRRSIVSETQDST